MKTKILLTTFILLIAYHAFSQTAPLSNSGAGATVIVHGWDPDGNQPAWMTSMADAIITRAGGGQTGTITVTGTTGSLTATCDPWSFDLSTQTNGEIVVLVNWTAVANHLTTSITAQEVAAAVVPKLYQSQNSQPAVAELPIHLIGHSRGGGMVFEIARLLGEQGIDVEHLTALDPHPLTASDPQPIAGDVIDTPIELYENVLFADCYYQDFEAPTGEYVPGAFNRQWSEMTGGYHNETGYTYTIGATTFDFSNHLNTILAYHGTIDLTTPVTNGEATLTQTERDNWFNTYESEGDIEGFYYSRILRGDRTSTDVPVIGGDKVADGFHYAFTEGYGARATQNWTTATWPNVLKTELMRSGTTIEPGFQLVDENETFIVKYYYRSYATAPDITLYVDTDRNPYNDNNAGTITTETLVNTGSSFTQNTNIWSVTGLVPGTSYYVYAEITTGTETRYAYLQYELELAAPPTIISQPSSQTNECPGSTVEYVVEANNATAYQWQVNLAEGSTWTDISDGADYSGVTTNTLTVTTTAGMDGDAFKCTASNSHGDVSSSSALLGMDGESPIFTSSHNNRMIYADANCETTLPDYTVDVTAIDNCDATLDVTQDPIAGTIISGATNDVTLTVTDDLGNAAEVTFNVMVKDITDPVITSTHNDQVVADEANCEASLPDYTTDVIATDNCDAALDITQNPTAGTTISGATNTVTLTVTDDSENFTEVSFNVAVEDSTDPVVTSTHNDQIVDVDANCEATMPDYTTDVTATDNCDATLDITQNPTAGTTISGAVNAVTLTVTDDAGNFAEVAFNVATEDNTAPVITSTHDDQILPDETNCEATLPDYTADVTATDNCDATLDITQNPIAGTVISGAVNTVTLTATDDTGNFDEVTFNVAVEDNSDPVITSTHDDQIVDADANCEFSMPDYTTDVTATDNCDATLDITQNPTAGTTIFGAANTVTLTATDGSGNFTEVTFNVAVEDNSDPVITSTHNDQIVDADANCEATMPDYTTDVTATDNCDATLDITQIPTAGTTISGAANAVTLTATDDVGNFDDITFNVAVEDNSDPVITSTHDDQIVDADANCEFSMPDYTTDVTATDNCDATLDITQNPTAGTTIFGAANTVTLTATDGSGNFTEVTFNVAVEDNSDPVISCIANTTIDADESNTYTVDGTEFDPTETSDNCGVATVENNFNSTATLAGEQLPEGVTTIVWTITDNSGNQNSCTFDVTVNEYIGISNTEEAGILIYPNPAKTVLNIERKDAYIQQLTISNVCGKQILQKTNIEKKEVINIEAFEDGIYIIQIQTPERTFTTKIVKE